MSRQPDTPSRSPSPYAADLVPTTPKKKVPAFKPRTPRTPQAAIPKYDPSAPTLPYPVGDYLIVRGILATEPPLAPLHQLKRAIDKVTDADFESFGDVEFTLSNGPYSTSAYIHLHPDHNPTEKEPEPRVDWLEALADGLRTEFPDWDTAWAPARDKDKRTWVRILGVFKVERAPADHVEKRTRREEDLKVVAALRKTFDDKGHSTVDGFRVSSGDAAIIVFAHPSHADAVVTARNVRHGGESFVASSVRQIEIERPFEIAVGGFSKFPDSNARDACTSWFASFNKNGVSLLAETRTDPGEKDYVFYTMADWTTTQHVLSTGPVAEDFLFNTSKFGLHPPQLIYNMNTNALWRKDVYGRREGHG